MANSTSAPRAKSAELRPKAMEMRKLGMTFEEIGKKLGISRQAAHRHIKKVMTDYNEGAKEQAQEYRTLNLMRLEGALKNVYMRALGGDLQAVKEARMLIKDISTLVGAEMPTKIASTNKDGEDSNNSGIIIVPPVSNSIDEWLQQVQQASKSE